MSCRVHVHFVIGSFFLRLPIMQHILPLLSFDTRIEIEKWKLLNKFRAAVSVLRTSFDFFLLLFPQEMWSSHRVLHKESWSGFSFLWWKHSYLDHSITKRRWLTWLKHKAPRTIQGEFSENNLVSLYMRALAIIFNSSHVYLHEVVNSYFLYFI